MKRYNRWIGFVVLLLLATGCAVQGRPFERFPTYPAGKARITIYRPPSFVGAAVYYDIRDGDQVVTTMRNGGFYTYLREPGHVKLSAKTEWKNSVEFDASADKDYYVKAGVSMGFFIGHPTLKGMTEGAALQQIGGCAELPGSYRPGEVMAAPAP